MINKIGWYPFSLHANLLENNGGHLCLKFYQIIMAVLFDFQVSADLPFIHESEVDLLNRICRLGSYFQKFQTFCRKYTEVSPFIRESSSDGGHYLFQFNLFPDAVACSYAMFYHSQIINPKTNNNFLKAQYCPLCFTCLCYCFGLHRSDASIVQRRVKRHGQYWVFNNWLDKKNVNYIN